MNNRLVLYLHGFVSSGQGTKAQYFRRKFESMPHTGLHAFEFNPTARDFEFMTITGLICRLRQYLLDSNHHDVSIIGSSLGALVALNYAHRFGGIDKMLLLAPALTFLTGKYSETELQRWQRDGKIDVAHYAFGQKTPLRYDYYVDGLHYLKRIPPPTSILIVHGQQDGVVPIENSRAYAASYPDLVQLIAVESDHRLNDQLDRIWGYVQSFLMD